MGVRSSCILLCTHNSHSLTVIDGQLGFEGENSTLPHLVEGFHDLKSPDSVTDGSKMKTKPSLKV